MCTWKLIESLVTWKYSKMAVNYILNIAVKLTAVSVKKVAAPAETQFTY
jgi:hypothetical protein